MAPVVSRVPEREMTTLPVVLPETFFITATLSLVDRMSATLMVTLPSLRCQRPMPRCPELIRPVAVMVTLTLSALPSVPMAMPAPEDWISPTLMIMSPSSRRSPWMAILLDSSLPVALISTPAPSVSKRMAWLPSASMAAVLMVSLPVPSW